VFAHFRFARPVSNLVRSTAMYVHGLGLQLVDSFEDHGGFDGVMLGHPGLGFHFEFTFCRHDPAIPAPTREDLVVVYLPSRTDWADACARMFEAGFTAVIPSNPYWNLHGRTFIDPDGYCVVVAHDRWPGADGPVDSVNPPAPRA
jgi:hypothetical protein